LAENETYRKVRRERALCHEGIENNRKKPDLASWEREIVSQVAKELIRGLRMVGGGTWTAGEWSSALASQKRAEQMRSEMGIKAFGREHEAVGG
jgi:hypothetical protein